ncbi:DUF4126 domain-containing protein [Orenia marismortui]|uniref:Uncharacterized protein DUF4126 n=1 Tax=Orenia marismortui TaxID=46469 RepID=A0A4R8GLX9_9FIRM|nr:DUF4126 domain-containing protein [Orenia marismortui]TDX46615.1 uncharacterized protein DUF4126 [Orenia marismortui]
MNLILSMLIGVGLSAACGFRVFIPLLVMSISALTGNLELASDFQWIGSDSALYVFTIATILEMIAYYIPQVESFLSSISTTVTAIAGTIVMSSFVVDVSPLLQWSLAIIAGGGTSTVVQASRNKIKNVIGLRDVASNNFSLLSLEILTAVLLSSLLIISPVLTLFLIAIIILILFKKFIFNVSIKFIRF